MTSPTLELERTLLASPDVVFAYFTDPERHTRWLGVAAELDPRPGGVYRVEVTEGVALVGEFVVVEPPRRLVFTWGWESAVALPERVDRVTAGSTTVEVTLTPVDGGTRLNLRHSGFPGAQLAGRHEHGWVEGFARLAAAIADAPAECGT